MFSFFKLKIEQGSHVAHLLFNAPILYGYLQVICYFDKLEKPV